MEVKLKEVWDHSINFADTKSVSASEYFVTVSTFYKIGSDINHNMVLLTPEEAVKLRDALNGYIDEYKTKGIL